MAETVAGRIPEIAAATAIWCDDIVPDGLEKLGVQRDSAEFRVIVSPTPAH